MTVASESPLFEEPNLTGKLLEAYAASLRKLPSDRLLEKENSEMRVMLLRVYDYFAVSSGTSNWPPSLTDSPFFLGAKTLLDDVRALLDSYLKTAGDTGDQSPEDKTGEDSPKDDDKSSKTGKTRRYSHPGARQNLQRPDEVRDVYPTVCPRCGSTEFDHGTDDFWIHQILELQELMTHCLHLHLHRSRCRRCGALVSAQIPSELSAGYGARLTALIAELSGGVGATRRNIQSFLSHVLNLDVSLGAIDTCIDRASESILPHFTMAMDEARQLKVLHVDETSWRQFGPPGREKHWCWTMCHGPITVFKIYKHRSGECFLDFIKDWNGILISDDYGMYTKRADRQPCLAHLLRKAKKFAQSPDPTVSAGGSWIYKELKTLVGMKYERPSVGIWRAWHARFSRCLKRYASMKNDLGTFAARLTDEQPQLSTFLREKGVEPTNNNAERALRTPVCRRKVSIGSTSEKGERWIERSLTLRALCRSNGKSYFNELTQAIDCRYHRTKPDLSWIQQAADLDRGTMKD